MTNPLKTVSVRGTTRVVGVLGYPVKHSASPQMHNAAFAELGLDWVYVPFAVAPDNLGAALAGIRALGMAGVNVTVPLKEQVAPHLDALTERAQRLGSVNTVVNVDGRLVGDSTDGPGLLAALRQAGVTVEAGMQVVVLGAGGSSRAVVSALADAGATIVVANRNLERAQSLAQLVDGNVRAIALDKDTVGEALSRASVLINTTSVGMHPNEDGIPSVPLDALRPGLFVSDLIYNPQETRLLQAARERGCVTQNGVEMLVQQGALAFSQWTGIDNPPIKVMRHAVLQALSKAA